MKVCIPVTENCGVRSSLSEHFGSAPFFLIYDLDSNTYEMLVNSNQHHEHGACNPLQILARHTIDAVICLGIGAGALTKLHASGMKVYRGSALTAEELVKNFLANSVSELAPEDACRNHDCH